MIRINQVKMPETHTLKQVHGKVAQILKCNINEIKKIHIVKQSVDARKKPEIFYSYVVEVEMDGEAKRVKKAQNPNVTLTEPVSYVFPQSGDKPLKSRPVIIGEGPAGLFCGYFLAMAGYQPLILERGKDVDARMKDVQEFWESGLLNTESNVQFGEGGAGTFSDGKLNTLIKDKDGKGKKVLEIFVECGAPEAILYENKPHIGTDILVSVVKNMRNKIIEMGGEVRFESQVTDICISDGKVCAVKVNEEEIIPCKIAVLAIGHSSRNTFEMLYERKVPMEAKSFAVGFRVEHPQKMIDYNQYGKEKGSLPTAAYKLTAKTSAGRGVYSFCMCPGGYVVNASSEKGRLAVNGMSYSARDGENANSAIIVSVSPEDFGSEHPLAGLSFQRQLEEKAYLAGAGKVPVQTYGNYRKAVNKKLTEAGMERVSFGDSPDDLSGFESIDVKPNIKGQFAEADLSGILPLECGKAFVEGMEQFQKNIRGFAHPNALLAGVESRTSSPVRIHRDETGQSKIFGLYPCGEGAGYAGGITSAAMDGISIAEKIAMEYAQLRD
ncbi:MAG: FAD-dependent oxidoreductase [Lachnospiraceae bacterium]|nr:FAD-dependent oxidoreductase [Lachnospiraceae bacterium]